MRVMSEHLGIVLNIFLLCHCTEVTYHMEYYYCFMLSLSWPQLSPYQLLLPYAAVATKQTAAHKTENTAREQILLTYNKEPHMIHNASYLK